MKTSEILERAHALISQPGAHAKGFYAYDKSGVECFGHEPEAVCWCAIGSIQHVTGGVMCTENQGGAAAYLALDAAASRVVGHGGIAIVNDHQPRETLDACFHTAIATAKEQEAV